MLLLFQNLIKSNEIGGWKSRNKKSQKMKVKTKVIFAERLASLLCLLDVCAIALFVFMEEQNTESFKDWWETQVIHFTFMTSLVDVGLLAIIRSIMMGLVSCSFLIILNFTRKKSSCQFPLNLILLSVTFHFLFLKF